MPDPVYQALLALRKISFTLGFYGPEKYVLFNVRQNGLPIAISTLEDGFSRACALIGIPDDKDYKNEGREPLPGSAISFFILVVTSPRRFWLIPLDRRSPRRSRDTGPSPRSKAMLLIKREKTLTRQEKCSISRIGRKQGTNLADIPI